MTIGHPIICDTLAKQWEQNAHNFNAYETLNLIEWVHEYSINFR